MKIENGPVIRPGTKSDQELFLKAQDGDENALREIMLGDHAAIILEAPYEEGKTIADPGTKVTLVDTPDNT